MVYVLRLSAKSCCRTCGTATQTSTEHSGVSWWMQTSRRWCCEGSPPCKCMCPSRVPLQAASGYPRDLITYRCWVAAITLGVPNPAKNRAVELRALVVASCRYTSLQLRTCSLSRSTTRGMTFTRPSLLAKKCASACANHMYLYLMQRHSRTDKTAVGSKRRIHDDLIPFAWAATIIVSLYCSITFEDLTCLPGSTMREVMSFLGLPDDQPMPNVDVATRKQSTKRVHDKVANLLELQAAFRFTRWGSELM